MNIGISTEFLGVKRNGTATYSRNFLRGLALLETSDRFVPYLTTKAALPLVPRSANITPRLVYPYNAYVRLTATLPLELLHHPVDILHAQGWGPAWSPCPMVLTVHDIGWERFPEIYPKALALRLSYLVRDSVRRAARIVASSHATAADLVELYGIPREKIRVIYPASDPDITQVTDTEQISQVKRHYGLVGPYILYVGSVEPKKNVHRLIEAYAQLRRAGRIAQRLVIAGKALWLSEAILALPTQLGIAQDVVFTGPVDQADLAALYSGADLFAFLGMYEGFGYTPIEAMACGVPTLVANRTSLPEVVGNAALLVDPDHQTALVESLARLVNDAPLRKTLRLRGLERSQHFQLLPHAQAMLEVFHEAHAAHVRGRWFFGERANRPPVAQGERNGRA